MAEHFSFFDPVLQGGLPDRDYNAQQFTNYFNALVTTGLMKGEGNELAVATSGSNMVTTINTGVAFVEGRQYINTELLPHTHDTESLGKNRIDRIVVRMDLNTDARYVKSFVKKGVASASPVAPVLTQTPNIYEISLAQIKVIGGQTFINKVDVVDERGKDIICPWAGSNILPNFDDQALEDLVTDVAGKASKNIHPIVELVLINGWTHNVTYKLKMYKDDLGRVYINGRIQRTEATTNSPLLIPIGYRPNGNRIGVATSLAGGGAPLTLNQVEIGATGDMYIGSSSLNLLFNFSYQIEN